MVRPNGTARRVSITLLGTLMLAALAPTVAQGKTDAASCRVRNVTRDTVGNSFRTMVAAARDGNRLRVRGQCLARGISVGVSIVIVGVGEHRPVLDAAGE